MPSRPKTEKGLPVVLGFLMAMILLGYSIYGLLHKGVNWPLKYPAPGALEWPAAALLMLGAAMVFTHGAYFLFVLPPSAGPERPRNFFRILNWLGVICVIGAGFLPDNFLAQLQAAAK